MQDTSSPDRLDAQAADSLRRAVLGTPAAPLLARAKPLATSREKKAKLAAMKPEERRAAEAKRKVEAKLARAEARVRQWEADWTLLHQAGRCWDECPVCGRYAEVAFVEEAERALTLTSGVISVAAPCPEGPEGHVPTVMEDGRTICLLCWQALTDTE